MGAFTEHSSRTSTSNDPWLLSQPLEVQDFFSVVRVTHTQKSQVVYFEVMDAKADSKDSVITPLDSLLDDISNYLQSIPKEKFSQLFNQRLQALDKSMSEHYDEFKSFIQTRAQGDDTWRFWVQFVFQDPMAYVGLFLAIRSGDLELRMGSMKFIAPVFTAFDHHIYQNLISY